MIRVHHYCDCCNKQISYVDSDGEVCVQGVLASGMDINVKVGFNGGESSSRHSISIGEYCSYDCFEMSIRYALVKTKLDCEKMKE